MSDIDDAALVELAALDEREVMDVAVVIAALLAGRIDGQQAVASIVAQVDRSRAHAALVAEVQRLRTVEAAVEALAGDIHEETQAITNRTDVALAHRGALHDVRRRLMAALAAARAGEASDG